MQLDAYFLVLGFILTLKKMIPLILNLNANEHTCTCLHTCAQTHRLLVLHAFQIYLFITNQQCLFTDYRDGLIWPNIPNDVERPFQIPIFYFTHGQK